MYSNLAAAGYNPSIAGSSRGVALASFLFFQGAKRGYAAVDFKDGKTGRYNKKGGNTMNVSEKFEAVKKALRELGANGRVEATFKDGLAVVTLNDRYFGRYDFERGTFVD